MIIIVWYNFRVGTARNEDAQRDTTGAPPGLGTWPAFLLYKAGWVLQRLFERVIEPFGLKGRHFLVLTMLAADDTLSQQEMSEAMSLDPNIMVSLVDDLEAWGLAERRRNPKDRRRYVVSLTEEGRSVYKEARRAVEEVEASFFSVLSDEERELLGEMAGRLMAPHWGRPPATK
jgi:DNA-binding MarR family transcriptional regulator